MVFLIDASVYVFRAYFALPHHLSDPAGRPVNAVYGFAQFLVDFLKATDARHMAVAFDESLTTSFRNDIYPEYKANREQPPEDLIVQFQLCRQLCGAMGLFHWASEHYEADDLIGTLARLCRQAGCAVTVVSRDKDLTQLIHAGDLYLDFARGKSLDPDGVADEIGVRPEQVDDWLALTGDGVDNIPGVPGIGKKTAAALLRHFDDLDAIFAGLGEVVDLPIRGARKLAEKLEEHEQTARLAHRLTQIKCDVPTSITIDDLRRAPVDPAALQALFDELGFGSRLRSEILKVSAEQ